MFIGPHIGRLSSHKHKVIPYYKVLKNETFIYKWGFTIGQKRIGVWVEIFGGTK